MRISWGERFFNVFNVLFMLVTVLVTLYPMLFVVLASISKPTEMISHTGLLLKPLGFDMSAYRAVLQNPSIMAGYLNTAFVVVFGVIINILVTSLGAYFLSRKGVLLRNAIMFFIVFTMYFNGGLIPFYFAVRDLHLDNTLWSLIFPVAVNTINLIIMRTAFAAIPSSMEESAKLDGAGHCTILFRIMMPIAMPTVAVMVLYYGVSHWNAWFNATIFIQKRELFPLQVILREILIQNDTNMMTTNASSDERDMISVTIRYAVIIVATLPILALYPLLQKYFVKGVMIGAIKE